MLSYVFMALSALGSILLVFGTQIHWLWLLPIGLGMYVALNALFFLGLWFSTIFLPKKDPIDKPRNFYGIIQFVCDWAMTALRVKIRFNGMEKLPNEPFVLVSNHVSNFDPVVVLAKVKGIKKALDATAAYAKAVAVDPENEYALIVHSDREKYAYELKEKVESVMKFKKVFVGDVFSGCGTNIGPGMVGIYFLGEPISEDLAKEKDTLNSVLEK